MKDPFKTFQVITGAILKGQAAAAWIFINISVKKRLTITTFMLLLIFVHYTLVLANCANSNALLGVSQVFGIRFFALGWIL